MRALSIASAIALALTFGIAATSYAADPPNPAEAKLREGLKNTMLQLRTVQGEKAALEGDKATLEAKVSELIEKLEKLEKQSADEKAAADKRVAEQVERLVERGNVVTKLETDLSASQKAQKEASAIAAKKEAERAKLNSEKIVLQRKVADQQTKNAEMYRLGTEVLTRFEKFGLGTAIAAREPFVGLTKVKFLSLIQGTSDQIIDQKIKP